METNLSTSSVRSARTIKLTPGKSSRSSRVWRHPVTCSYQNGSRQSGDSASGSSRAALAHSLDTSIDISREAVTTQTVPPSGERRKFEVSWFDAMKFQGPGPEKINGRLAMLGFVLGTINEFKTATPILQQALEAQLPVAVTVLLITWASLTPIRKGARAEAFGIFSPKAETTNGRAAMLGLGVLLLLEQRAGVSFF